MSNLKDACPFFVFVQCICLLEFPKQFSESLIHVVFCWADAECTLACLLTAHLWPIPQTPAAEFQNVRADPSITSQFTTTWSDPPHRHPTHSMWFLLDLTTPSTAQTRSNQAPTIHSFHQEVSLSFYDHYHNIVEIRKKVLRIIWNLFHILILAGKEVMNYKLLLVNHWFEENISFIFYSARHFF